VIADHSRSAGSSARRRLHADGFTLVELAVALVIITLLLGSVLVPLASQVEQRKIWETQRTLDQINEALIGYAITRGHLPCPAISAANGLEDRTGGTCTGNKRQGFLPWAELGVSKLDAWGHIFRYSVTLAFANSAAPFTLSSTRDITLYPRDNTGTQVNLSNSSDIPAVVISHGPDGLAGIDDQGIAVALPSDWPASYADENLNATSATSFMSRTSQGAAGGTGGSFDDLVVWISPNVLFNRMVAAQKLP